MEHGDLIDYKKAVKSFWYNRDTHEWLYNKSDEPGDAESVRSHSTTFTEMVQPRRYNQRDKLSIQSSDINSRCNIASVNVTSKKEYLQSLLSSQNDHEKQILKQITGCVKLMYKQYGIDYKQLNKFFNSLVKDLLEGQMQTHMPFAQFERQF